MIQSALVAKLKNVTSKVYANVAPQSVSLPVVTVDMDGSFRERHYGTSGIETGLIETDFEINVWGKHNSDCFGLAEQLIAEIENFSGPLRGMDSPQTIYGVAEVRIDGEAGGFDGETKLYQYTINLMIKHTTEV
ncbi:MAG: hypothetical protein ACN2B6_00615 [Rickettsiales bacterium]